MSVSYDERPLCEVSRDEAWDLLDHAARRWLSMSADEFAERYDRGDVDDTAATMYVASLLDLARQ